MTAFAGGLSPAQVVTTVQQRLLALRQALEQAADLQQWSSAIAEADMSAVTGLDDADTATLKSAIADAAALADMYDTGLPPAGYPQPASAYTYGASQRLVIGPM